jgi:hypothetical protein
MRHREMVQDNTPFVIIEILTIAMIAWLAIGPHPIVV